MIEPPETQENLTDNSVPAEVSTAGFESLLADEEDPESGILEFL